MSSYDITDKEQCNDSITGLCKSLSQNKNIGFILYSFAFDFREFFWIEIMSSFMFYFRINTCEHKDKF